MKKIALAFMLIFLLIILCVSCNDTSGTQESVNSTIEATPIDTETPKDTAVPTDTEIPTDTEASSNIEIPIDSDNPNEAQNSEGINDISTILPSAVETYDGSIFVKGFSWESFEQTINSGDVGLNTAEINSDILNTSVEIDGYTLSSIDYTHHTDGDWELSIYWYPIESVGVPNTDICSFTAFIQDGYDSVGILRGYTLIDEENKIYFKSLGDRVSYICLINDTIFNRSSIPKSNPGLESSVEQLRNYVLEIKATVNQDVTR